MFTKPFSSYVAPGDFIECETDGFTVRATIHHDSDTGAPDEEDDGFWPSLDPSSAGYIGPKSKSTLRRHTAKARAVMAAWKADEWYWCGVVLSVSRNGIDLDDHAASLWGVECNYPGSDNTYLLQVANEMLAEAVDGARDRLRTLCADFCAHDEAPSAPPAGPAPPAGASS